MIERIDSLAPSPYRYGSELALSQFPRFNDLGLFAEFAIANTVMEEPAPRREPACASRTCTTGIGFVGVISGHDHEVARWRALRARCTCSRCWSAPAAGCVAHARRWPRSQDGVVRFDIDPRAASAGSTRSGSWSRPRRPRGSRPTLDRDRRQPQRAGRPEARGRQHVRWRGGARRHRPSLVPRRRGAPLIGHRRGRRPRPLRHRVWLSRTPA